MEESEYRLLKVFKALNNCVRFEILKILNENKEGLNTEELAKQTKRLESNISQHLKVLKNLDIVKYKTVGKNVEYSIKNKELIKRIFELEDLFMR